MTVTIRNYREDDLQAIEAMHLYERVGFREMWRWVAYGREMPWSWCQRLRQCAFCRSRLYNSRICVREISFLLSK